MNRKLLFQSSLRSMMRNKLRTLFMSIGVIIGVGTLIAGQSLGTGAEKEIKQRVNKIFSPGSIMLVSQTLTYSDVEAIESQMDQIVASAPRWGYAEFEIGYQDVNRKAAVFGHTVEGETVWNRGVTEGRYFTSSDISKTARVALIGHRLSQLLFGEGGEAVDQEIMIGTVPFRIIGVLEPQGIDPHGEDRDVDIFVPITTAMQRLYKSDYIGIAKLIVTDMEMVDDDADEIAEILRKEHSIALGEDEDFAIYTSKFAGRLMQKANKILTVYMAAAAAVVLLVAAIVIASIMLVIVRERVAEIGLRKALGATEKNISFQFLAEVITVTVISGVLGIGLGLGAASLVSAHIDMPVIVTTPAILMALGSAILVGIASGIAPARKAARLDPVEALR